MKPARVLGLWTVILAATAARLPAQTTGAQMLQRAIHLYEEVALEDALTILRQIVAPVPTLEVSEEERTQAYKYMGAVFALQPGAEKHDSAFANFSAAIARDPGVDLDPQTFTPAQLAVFAEARNRTFVVAVRPLRRDTLDYGSTMLVFQCLSSHASVLRAELRSGGETVLVLFDGASNGLRQLAWDGSLPGRALPVPGRYEMVVTGQSSVTSRADSAAVYFDLQLVHPPLADTLPDLGPQDLLPEVGVPTRDIPANVVENQRRRADRAEINAAVVEHNAQAMRRSRLVITPLAGGGP